MLEDLRHATRARHIALDSALDLRAATVDRARYAAFLRATFRVVHPLEQRLTALPGWSAALPGAERRRKAGLLENDLAYLREPAADDGAVPEVSTLAQGFGCAYVLEGSTLGGAVLARELGPALGLSPEHGMSYMAAYGADLGAMWRSFMSALADLDARITPAERRAVVSAAAATFDAFRDRFAEAGLLSA